MKSLKEQNYSYNRQKSQQYDQPRQLNKKGRKGGSQGYRGSYSEFEEEQRSYKPSGPIKCFKCGQEGHIALGCRVRTDFQRKPLNYKESASGDEGLAQRRKVPENRN